MTEEPARKGRLFVLVANPEDDIYHRINFRLILA